MFGLFNKRRRLIERPVPDHWIEDVSAYLPTFIEFSDDEARRFLDHLKILMWDKHWVGADFELNDSVKVVIAAQAARMVRGLELSAFDRHSEFIIYGRHFHNPDDDEALPGPMYGEAHHFGTVVLSWPAVVEGLHAPCRGFNTIIHEMAHILDVASGYFDGTPVLHHGKDYAPWAAVCQKYFDEMRTNPDDSFLDLYGCGDESEFFAVASEAFFELPDIVADEAPDLFAEFRRFYRVDPRVIPCNCETHEWPDDEYEEVGYPLIPARDPMEDIYF